MTRGLKFLVFGWLCNRMVALAKARSLKEEDRREYGSEYRLRGLQELKKTA